MATNLGLQTLMLLAQVLHAGQLAAVVVRTGQEFLFPEGSEKIAGRSILMIRKNRS